MFWLLFLPVLLFTGCCDAQSSWSKDVENPKKLDAGKYQWIVAIVGLSRQNNISICTGYAISKTLILSSAWCVEQLPGELNLFSAKAVEEYKRTANVSIVEASLPDHYHVAGCLSHLIFHPCYSRVQHCTNAVCHRVSWKCDLVVLVTTEEMVKDVKIMPIDFLEWKPPEMKDCVFIGFDYALMYAVDKDVDQFFLVESKIKARRGTLPCKMWASIVDGIIWSTSRFSGMYRFLNMIGGHISCGNKVAGIFLGKVDTKTCSVENHHDSKSTRKFWLSWTYLLPHKPWIDLVIKDPSKFPKVYRGSDAIRTVRTSTCLIWLALVVVIDWRVH